MRCQNHDVADDLPLSIPEMGVPRTIAYPPRSCSPGGSIFGATLSLKSVDRDIDLECQDENNWG